MKIERYIPNALTYANMFCGFIGILNLTILNSPYFDQTIAGWLIFAAAFFDLLDGTAARALKVDSTIGKQLDSFSDIISFGLLPGLILVMLLDSTNTNWVLALYFLNTPWIGILAFLFPMAAAYRLSRFNTADNSSGYFKGLPAPAAGLLVGSLPLIMEYDLLLLGYESIYLTEYVLDPWLLLGIIIVIPLLMVSNLSMLSLKFDRFTWKGNEVRFVFIILSVLLFILLFFAAIPVILVLYVLLSLFSKK